MEKQVITFTAETLADGRTRVVAAHAPRWSTEISVHSYTTVRNIDGSNRLMKDGGMWQFLPSEWQYAAGAAIAKLTGESYRWAHCLPANHVIA